MPSSTRNLLRSQGAALAIAITIGTPACGGAQVGDRPPVVQPNLETRPGDRIAFDFLTIDDKPLSSTTIEGRVTVIGFITTYDIASQAQARFLSALAKHHTPRINVALLVLEPAQNRPLVEAFASALKLNIPVAIADSATIAGEGPFAGLHEVPSVVILDRHGAEAIRNVGLLEERDLETAVKKVEDASK
jgi:hypothetical protein